MNGFLRNAALAAAVTLTGFTWSPPAVMAQGIILDLENGEVDVVPGRRYRERREERRCSVGDALEKARRMGYRRVELEREGRRTIRVSGRKRGDWDVLTFSRERGCPLLD